MMPWRYWDWTDWLMWLCIGLTLALLVGVVIFAVHDARWWSQYSEEHGCRRTGRSETSTTLTPISTGKTTILMPQTHTSYEWQCRGGEVIWR